MKPFGTEHVKSTSMPRILVIEDDMLIRRLLAELLRREGYEVVASNSIAEGTAEIARSAFDLVLLDLLLPDGDGLAACKRIRERHRMPIIIVSTRNQLQDRIAGLETGADDYIVKPFEPSEVVARVRAQLRRAQELSTQDDGVIHAGRMVVDPGLSDVLIDGKAAGLTKKEFELVQLLAQRLGKTVTRDFLMERLWPEEELSSEKNVAVYVRRIRQKIERDPDDPSILLTVRGIGYRVTGE